MRLELFILTSGLTDAGRHFVKAADRRGREYWGFGASVELAAQQVTAQYNGAYDPDMPSQIARFA